jgi:hypothetical protein
MAKSGADFGAFIVEIDLESIFRGATANRPAATWHKKSGWRMWLPTTCRAAGATS